LACTAQLGTIGTIGATHIALPLAVYVGTMVQGTAYEDADTGYGSRFGCVGRELPLLPADAHKPPKAPGSAIPAAKSADGSPHQVFFIPVDKA
jgi:hypothetical protein